MPNPEEGFVVVLRASENRFGVAAFVTTTLARVVMVFAAAFTLAVCWGDTGVPMCVPFAMAALLLVAFRAVGKTG